MNEPSSDKPKIIVDEDWKTQVQREREQQQQGDEAPETDPGMGEETDPGMGEETDPGMGDMPPATFPFLVTSLVTQVMAALGQLPDPVTNERKVMLPYAKLNIDLLDVLQEKTKGNVTPDEATMLEEATHQLRMMYVAVRDQLASESPS